MNDGLLIAQLDILERIAKRGLKSAQRALDDVVLDEYTVGYTDCAKYHLDLWQHMLDEIKRI